MKRLLFAIALAPFAFAQFSPKPADAIIPVVGSTVGQSNAHFKTELQLTNRADIPSSGWLIYRPDGLLKRYELAPFATIAFADVVAEMGGTGLGSLDVLVDGGTLPTIVARAYDDQPNGTTGVTVPAIPIDAILMSNESRTLIVPRDLTRYRFNIGVRVVDEGARIDLILRSANGTTRHTRTLAYDPHEFHQHVADTFVGTTLQPNDSIEVRIARGSAIVYATTVDNVTNDGVVQVLRR